MNDLVFTRLPVDCPVTGYFGQTAGYGYPHRGMDLGCNVGTPVAAPAAGTVVSFSNDGGFGIAVCLDHLGTPWYSLYAHLSRADVSIGQHVAVGDVLGLTGNTGMSTGPHLHWQVCLDKTFPRDIARSADPLAFVGTEEDGPMTPEEVEAVAVRVAARVFDESSGTYFRDLMLKYFEAVASGDFSEPADAAVLKAIREPVPQHHHYRKKAITP